MRILCLDVGDRKIGLSLSDRTGSIAQGLKLVRRSGDEQDVKELEQIVADHGVEMIVVGLPKNLDGSVGARARAVMELAGQIEKTLRIPVVTWDERFSTNEAHRVFDSAGMSQKKRKPFLDVIASQIILQGYLDAQKGR